MPTQEQDDQALIMENFLLRVVPGLAKQWQGSTQEEITQIERLSGRPLPPFYRWFLSRMGQSMGPLSYPRVDFSARRVISSHADALATPHSKLLFIGYDSDEMMPLHFFYDLNLPARGDARVTRQNAVGGERHEQFETFRELLAYGALLNFRVVNMPQRCRVMLKSDGPDTFSQLDPVMDGLGFTKPIPTGPFCGLYERQDAVMLCSKTPRDKPQPFMIFRLGGRDSGTLRSIMGAIATRSSFRLEVKEWDPPIT